MPDARPSLGTLSLPVIASAAAIPALHGDALMEIISERIAQVDKHGYTLERDAEYTELELPAAACAYLITARDLLVWQDDEIARRRGAAVWPWDHASFAPKATARENLVKAAALIWAALDRFDTVARTADDEVPAHG